MVALLLLMARLGEGMSDEEGRRFGRERHESLGHSAAWDDDCQ